MTAGPAFASIETALVAAARSAWERGWAPATSGNLSVRLPRGRFLVTGSGCDKGLLERADLVVVGAEGRPEAAGRTPSAETALHLARYRSDDRIGAIVHVHALQAVVASRVWTDAVVLQGFELVKALPGVPDPASAVRVPIFDNDQDIAALAGRVEAALPPDAFGYLLRGHGLYTWGRDLRAAMRHVEALEALFAAVLAERGTR